MKGNFKLISIVVFVIIAVFGVIVFSGLIDIGGSGNQSAAKGTVTLWGTARKDLLVPLFDKFNVANGTFEVKYVQKSPDTFGQDLLEAIAAGAGPDMFFLTDDLALSYANKIYTIPYASYPLATFKSTYAGAGEVFLTSRGILAFPLTIDPLMMYYSRSTLDANDIVYPPASWEEFTGTVSLLTKKDEGGKLLSSAVGFGQYANVAHAKEIISTLFMQGGSSIVLEDGGQYYSDLTNSKSGANLAPFLAFYTSFADPESPSYSWNRSLPYSRDLFSADKLAFYFGFASELDTLINKNPNQNFFVAPVPQIKKSGSKLTSARVTGVAVSNLSKNLNTAVIAAGLLSQGPFAYELSTTLKVPPARRDLLAVRPTDAYNPIFYSSALYAKSWLDPSYKDTESIFRSMVEAVISGNQKPGSALSIASSRLGLLLK